jgi:hypothetical protein
VFASYLKALDLESEEPNSSPNYINYGIDASSGLQASHGVPESSDTVFMDAESSMSETTTYLCSSKMPFRIDEHWQSDRILAALVVTSRTCIDFFASETDFYDGMKLLQSHVRDWEPYQILYHESDYKALKSEAEGLKKKEISSSPNAIAILNTADLLTQNLNQKILGSLPVNSTALDKLNPWIDEMEKRLKGLIEACESIYKAPTKRQDKKNEQGYVDMLADDGGSVSIQDDRSTNGYHIVILDNTALESFVGPTFHHPCKAMKEVEAAKASNAEITAGTAESGPWICPVEDCEKHQKPYAKLGYLRNRLRDKHPECEPSAKRRKLNPM